ncbi:hypothetical protein [Cellulomonas sp. RIT-PI-Y]|uniref:hypothetical protein n=1 Tax=Cellulomonas sp. RIT-PI-Y TaxID=3035297 RepID=UPI0021D90B70|nr:hypothetical protein [Cellulomonas sp. RIT-PI-Y]
MRNTLSTPVRWSAPTPGMPARMTRLRFIAGDAGADGTAGADSATKAGQSGAGDSAPGSDSTGQQDQQQASQQGHQPGDGLPDDPQALKAMIGDLRKEAGAARTNAKATAAQEARDAVLQEFGKALGFIKDGDGTPDVDALTKQATDAQVAARTAQIELAVFRTAGNHEGDPNALLDSRAFLAKVADLDPTDAEFQTKVDAAVKAAIADNPKLKAAQAAARSGTDLTGGTGEGRSTTPKSLTDAVASRIGAA